MEAQLRLPGEKACLKPLGVKAWMVFLPLASLSSSTLGPEVGQPACRCCGETQDRRPFLQALLGLEGLLEGLEEPARYWGFPGRSGGKEPTCNAGDIRDEVRSLGWEDPLEKEMAKPSSILIGKSCGQTH